MWKERGQIWRIREKRGAVSRSSWRTKNICLVDSLVVTSVCEIAHSFGLLVEQFLFCFVFKMMFGGLCIPIKIRCLFGLRNRIPLLFQRIFHMNNLVKVRCSPRVATEDLNHTRESYVIGKDRCKKQECIENKYRKQEFPWKRRRFEFRRTCENWQRLVEIKCLCISYVRSPNWGLAASKHRTHNVHPRQVEYQRERFLWKTKTNQQKNPTTSEDKNWRQKENLIQFY